MRSRLGSGPGFEHLEAFGAEDLIEAVDELTAAVTHQRPSSGGRVGVVKEVGLVEDCSVRERCCLTVSHFDAHHIHRELARCFDGRKRVPTRPAAGVNTTVGG